MEMHLHVYFFVFFNLIPFFFQSFLFVTVSNMTSASTSAQLWQRLNIFFSLYFERSLEDTKHNGILLVR